jgi:Fe2+ or Zn2+ uptake regulation protein
MNTPAFEYILRASGSKATPGRIALLKVLSREKKPVTVCYLRKKLPALNEVTLYRALKPLVYAGVVREIDFRHGHAHYELNILREHHHHVICTSCGKVRDMECSIPSSTKAPPGFDSITDHAMEFFGVCRPCIKNSPISV